MLNYVGRTSSVNLCVDSHCEANLGKAKPNCTGNEDVSNAVTLLRTNCAITDSSQYGVSIEMAWCHVRNYWKNDLRLALPYVPFSGSITAFRRTRSKDLSGWKMVDASQVTVIHYGIIVTGLPQKILFPPQPPPIFILNYTGPSVKND
jgi:hypothetical protein